MILFLDSKMPEQQANMYGYLMIALLVGAIIINWSVILPSKVIEGIAAIQEMIKKRDDTIRYKIEKKYLVHDADDIDINEFVNEKTLAKFKKSKKGKKD